MVSHLFFYQLTLIALVWLCVLLHWVWPSDSAAPRARHPWPPHGRSGAVHRDPLKASSKSRTVTPVSTPPLPARKPPRLHPHASS